MPSKITPHIWFDKSAVPAAKFYASVFPNSRVDSIQEIKNTPSGDCDIVSFTINGQSFMAISAGPLFQVNPSVSFILNFDPSVDKNAKDALEKTWKTLSEGGKVLMPLDKYPFSEKYGWIQDKFGVSWQLILTNPNGEKRPFLAPALMFVHQNVGKAEEAGKFYRSVFTHSKAGQIMRYPAGMPPHKEGNVMFSDFQLENLWFAAMDSAGNHAFDFNEAISFIVRCDTQEEIDYFWKKLSAVPQAEQCGWLKDKYGLSWQITPSLMSKFLDPKNPEKAARVTKAFLQMKKFDIAALQRAYDGN